MPFNVTLPVCAWREWSTRSKELVGFRQWLDAFSHWLNLIDTRFPGEMREAMKWTTCLTISMTRVPFPTDRLMNFSLNCISSPRHLILPQRLIAVRLTHRQEPQQPKTRLVGLRSIPLLFTDLVHFSATFISPGNLVSIRFNQDAASPVAASAARPQTRYPAYHLEQTVVRNGTCPPTKGTWPPGLNSLWLEASRRASSRLPRSLPAQDATWLQR